MDGQEVDDVPKGFLPLEKAMAMAAMVPAVTRSLLPPALEAEFCACLLQTPETSLELPFRRMEDVFKVRSN